MPTVRQLGVITRLRARLPSRPGREWQVEIQLIVSVDSFESCSSNASPAGNGPQRAMRRVGVEARRCMGSTGAVDAHAAGAGLAWAVWFRVRVVCDVAARIYIIGGRHLRARRHLTRRIATDATIAGRVGGRSRHSGRRASATISKAAWHSRQALLHGGGGGKRFGVSMRRFEERLSKKMLQVAAEDG